MAEIIKITDLNNPLTSIYNMRSETALYRMNEPDPGIFIAETELVIKRALSAGYMPLSLMVSESKLDSLSDLLKECENRYASTDPDDPLPVYCASYENIKNLIGFPLTRGVLCAMKRKRLCASSDILRNVKKIAVLCDIENPTNIGTIFRNAAALNIDAVTLYGNCADPLYRRALRAGMGCQFILPWTSIESLETLKGSGFHLAAFALRNDSLTLSEFAVSDHSKKAILLGNEGYGLSDEILNICDSVIKIPMREGVDSLNVAVASGIAFYELNKI